MGTPSKRADLQLFKTCVRGAGAGLVQAASVFRLTGALTVTCRAWYDGNALVNVVADQSLAGVGLQYNTLFTVGISAGKAFYYREVNGAIGAVGVNSTVPMAAGRWYFLSWRRAASGDITIGVDDVYQTFVVTPPVDGSASQLQVGRDAQPGQLMNGGIADLAVWGARLSDAQVLPLYRACMGV
jgi:hypothetical protein